MPSSPVVASAGTRPRPSHRLYAVLLLLVLGFLAYPYVTLYRLGQALDRGDTATLDRLIDWDAVRGQFRDDMLARASAGMPREEGQGGGLGAEILNSLGKPLIDAASRGAMSSRLLVATYRNRFGVGETSPFQALRWAFFRSPREFAVTLRPLDNGPPLSFVLRLDGVVWRVNRVTL
jgi:hypothetical protein